MIDLTIHTNAEAVALDFKSKEAKVDAIIGATVAANGRALLTRVKIGASGWNGGPEVVTGRYFNSIRGESTSGASEYSFAVGTDEPYGHTLELGGMVGSGYTDSPNFIAPHPHFGPAFAIVEPEFISDLNKALSKILV